MPRLDDDGPMITIGFALGWCALVAAPQMPEFFKPPTIVDLGALADSWGVYPEALSADGTTVVGTLDGIGIGKAFRWNASTGIVLLTQPKILDYSQVWDVSADGSVAVGHYKSRAVLWDSNGAMQSLGGLSNAKPPASYAATAISDDGLVVFGYGFSSGSPKTFRWTLQTGMRELPLDIGWMNGYPTGTSSDGDVMVGSGWWRDDDERFGILRAFRWTPKSGLQALDALQEGWMSHAHGISGDGLTGVGWSGTGNGKGDHACRWTANGIEDLGTLPGDVWSEALDVNVDGTAIVGVSRINGAIHHAFMWTPQTGMVNLNTYLPSIGLPLGQWDLQYATGVNADGTRITGWGLLGNESRAWLVDLK